MPVLSYSQNFGRQAPADAVHYAAENAPQEVET